MASVKSAIALSYSPLCVGQAQAKYALAYFGSSRMASVKSAIALSYSAVSRRPRPGCNMPRTFFGSSRMASVKSVIALS